MLVGIHLYFVNMPKLYVYCKLPLNVIYYYYYFFQFYNEPEVYRTTLDLFNTIFTFMFTGEAILKLFAFRLVSLKCLVSFSF